MKAMLLQSPPSRKTKKEARSPRPNHEISEWKRSKQAPYMNGKLIGYMLNRPMV